MRFLTIILLTLTIILILSHTEVATAKHGKSIADKIKKVDKDHHKSSRHTFKEHSKSENHEKKVFSFEL